MPEDVLDAVFDRAGISEPTSDDRTEIGRLVELAETDPAAVVAEILRARRQRDHARKLSGRSAEAAGKLEEMLEKLTSGDATLSHVVRTRESESGMKAVCVANGYMRELPVHPDVDIDQLRSLQSWEYAAVRENMVVGLWRDDPLLFTAAMGDVVSFRGYYEHGDHLVRVMHGPEEKIVELDPSLWEAELTTGSSLILQRDNPQRAIGTLNHQTVQSRFEVPIESLDTCLDDLAGISEISKRMIRDILIHVCYEDLRCQFDLQPIKGILLYSRPGMGKTAMIRAVAKWLYDHREQLGFDVVLYHVKPNETKSMWHGEDSRIIREDLWGALRARQNVPRTRPLVQLVVFDELDSLGRRPGAGDHVHSAAQSDALESLLVEMDGLVRNTPTEGPGAHVLCIGLTNRPDRIDSAVKRPGRFDMVVPMPETTIASAEDVMAIYARAPQLPWYLGGQAKTEVDIEEIRQQMLRPALAWIYSMVVVRYKTDSQRQIEVTAGSLMANVHYMQAVNDAKRQAAVRQLEGQGVPAITLEDVIDGLLNAAISVARQMETDPQTLVSQLDITSPITTVQAVAEA